MNITDLAKQAGFDFDDYYDSLTQEQLVLFADLVRQDALEEAAKICNELNYNGMNSLHCAQAIRNRAEEINENT